MDPGSIRFRLTVWYAGVLAGILLLFSIAISAGVNHFLRRNLHDSVVKDTQEVGSIVRENANERDENVIGREVGEHSSPESNERAIRILSADGAVIYSSGPTDEFPSWDSSQARNEAFDPAYHAANGHEVI